MWIWFGVPMGDNVDSGSRRSTAAEVAGMVMLGAAVLLGIVGLPLALDDPCSGVSGCAPLVDFRPVGVGLLVLALLIGAPGAWLIHISSRDTDG